MVEALVGAMSHAESLQKGEAGPITEFASNLRSNCTLTALDVQGNAIGDRGAAAFAGLLKRNRSLLELNLQSAELGEESCKGFAEMIDINTTLETLFLGHNRIGDGVLRLKAALYHNPCIRRLGLQCCGVSPEVLLELRQNRAPSTIIA